MTIKVISYDGLDASVEENNSSLMVQKIYKLKKYLVYILLRKINNIF